MIDSGIKKTILAQLAEQDSDNEKISFDEYLRHTKVNSFPELLIDLFEYMGAKKYVAHVIKPEPEVEPEKVTHLACFSPNT